ATNKPNLLSMELTQVTAVAGEYGLGRPGAKGITPTTPVTVIDEGDGNAPTGLTTTASAWGTAPTVPANFNRRYICNNAIGTGFAAVFPAGFKIPANASVVSWIIATAPQQDINLVVSE